MGKATTLVNAPVVRTWTLISLFAATASFPAGCGPGPILGVGGVQGTSDETGVPSDTDAATEGSSDAPQDPTADSGSEPDSGNATGGPATTGDDGSTPPLCGDGELDRGEACDDGNAVQGDGCNLDCTPSGQQLWNNVVAADDGDEPWGHAVGVDGSGGAVIAGMLFRAEGAPRAAHVTAFDAQGAQRWQHVISEPASLQTSDVVITHDGAVSVAAYAYKSGLRPTLRRFSAAGDILPPQEVGPPDGSDGVFVASRLGTTSVVAAGCTIGGAPWLSRVADAGDPGWSIAGRSPGCPSQVTSGGDTVAMLFVDADALGAVVERYTGDGAPLDSTHVPCRGRLLVATDGTAYVAWPSAVGEPSHALCVVGPGGQRPALVTPAVDNDPNLLAWSGQDSLVSVAQVSDGTLAVQKTLLGGGGWLVEHAPGVLYALPFDIDVGVGGHTVVSGVYLDENGGLWRAFGLAFSP